MLWLWSEQKTPGWRVSRKLPVTSTQSDVYEQLKILKQAATASSKAKDNKAARCVKREKRVSAQGSIRKVRIHTIASSIVTIFR